jgi:hypothetical protein
VTWVPDWRVTVGDDVYTTVTAVSYATGRSDIDRQPSAGYCQVDIVNSTNAPFTINVTESVTLELKNSTGAYVTVFGGEVSDFNIAVRSPEETGYVTTGTILGVGSLSKLTKAIYNTALAEGLDGTQIADIVGAALNLKWSEVTPTVTWDTYPPTQTWSDAESYIGTIDPGFYTMINLAANATAKSSVLADQIAQSALGQLFEDRYGNVNYDDADHRSNYLAANGFTNLDGAYATPTSIQSQTQIARIRNSLIYRYSTDYASTYLVSDPDSIALYGLFEKSAESNIKSLIDITDIASRELKLRANPRGSLGAITFRLDNSNMPNDMLDNLISIFFGQPVLINNLPSNLLGGTFDGFVENIDLRANPTYVDMTLYISATDFSLSTTQWETVLPASLIWTGVNNTLIWTNATGALT